MRQGAASHQTQRGMGNRKRYFVSAGRIRCSMSHVPFANSGFVTMISHSHPFAFTSCVKFESGGIAGATASTEESLAIFFSSAAIASAKG